MAEGKTAPSITTSSERTMPRMATRSERRAMARNKSRNRRDRARSSHRGKMRGASTSGVGRGEAVRAAFAMFAGVGAPAMLASICAPAAVADFAYQPALVGKDYGKSKMTYPDFQQTASGLLYKVGALPPCAPPSRKDYTIIKPPPRC